MTHSLTDKDVERRTATCSVCGDVKIARSGNGWACMTKKLEANRKWNAEHPERSKHSTTEHRLQWQDVPTATGACVKCGPVKIVPWGRGYACATRATELGRVNQQDAPLTWCRDCWAEMEGDADRYRVWLKADGSCPRCSTGQDLHAELRAAEDFLRQLEDLDPGFHIEGLDPYAMDDYESAVPGWKTIGAGT